MTLPAPPPSPAVVGIAYAHPKKIVLYGSREVTPLGGPVRQIRTSRTTMKKILGLTTALMLLATVAYGQDVSYNFDQQADFSKYKTYKWVQVKDAEQVDQLTAQQITAAFEKQLALKGLTKATGDQADLAIAYQVAIGKEKQISTMDSGMYGAGWGPRYYGGYYGGGTSTTTTSTIFVGSVALDMYDSASKNLVWRSLASKQIDTKASPEKREKNLNKGAAKMLKNFPPKPKATS
jgi:Domain of unknown function (DUF4136)